MRKFIITPAQKKVVIAEFDCKPGTFIQDPSFLCVVVSEKIAKLVCRLIGNSGAYDAMPDGTWCVPKFEDYVIVDSADGALLMRVTDDVNIVEDCLPF